MSWVTLRFFGSSLALLAFLLLPVSLAFCITAPEKLEYDLAWTGITAGSATLETSVDAGSAHIVSVVKSARWVSVFFTVDDRIEAELRRAVRDAAWLPHRYMVNLREGRMRRSREVAFDQRNGTALCTDRQTGEAGRVKLRRRAYDPLSGLLHVRSLRMIPGTPLYVDIIENRKVANVEVRVLRRERLSTPAGVFDTVMIRPLMKTEGTFNRGGDLDIWLTDDDRHIPVRVRTKVRVGSVTATLVRGAF